MESLKHMTDKCKTCYFVVLYLIEPQGLNSQLGVDKYDERELLVCRDIDYQCVSYIVYGYCVFIYP